MESTINKSVDLTSSSRDSGSAGVRPGGASKLVSPAERLPQHTARKIRMEDVCPYVLAGEDPFKVCDEIYGFFPEEQAEICDACIRGKLYQPIPKRVRK